MGKEFDLGTGRTALGDNHWRGGAKAKMYGVCCPAGKHLISSRVGFLGRTGRRALFRQEASGSAKLLDAKDR
jgi:hypothetical protein